MKKPLSLEALKLELPFKPRVAQKIILNELAVKRFVTAICHRRLGKTLLAVYYLCTEGLAFDGDDYRGYYFGATQKAAKIVAWNYFKKLLAPLKEHGLVDYRETELQVLIKGKGIITLAGSENIEAYRGIYIDRMVADEVASWVNAMYAWHEVLRPAMADRLAHGLVIGTVKGLDLLYDFYVRGISRDPMDHEWGGVKLKASVTNILPDSEIEEMKHAMTEEAFAREMECDFFAATPDVLITPEEANSAMKRQLTAEQRRVANECPLIFGLDPGRTGDPTVLYARRGNYAEKVFSVSIPDSLRVADLVDLEIKKRRPHNVFMDHGQGQGVADRLYSLGHSNIVVETHFNQPSPERSCYNMRAAMYYRMKVWLRNGVLPDDPDLLQEIVNQQLMDDMNNRIRLAPKEKIKDRIGRSPNDSDALALTFAADSVDFMMTDDQKKIMMIDAVSRGINVPLELPRNSYDPLSYMEKRFTNFLDNYDS